MEMRSRQSTFDETGGTHCAALFTIDGTMLSVQEDIGRHNAVDKTIGELFLSSTLAKADILAVSGESPMKSFQNVQWQTFHFCWLYRHPRQWRWMYATKKALRSLPFAGKTEPRFIQIHSPNFAKIIAKRSALGSKGMKSNKSSQPGPAAGLEALASSLKHILHERAMKPGVKALLRMNKPGGFDCPGCAWPDPKNYSITEFCENGVKAIAAETTGKRITKEFFEKNTVADLLQKDGYWLEQQGRLTEPMRYNPKTDKYEPVTWEKAFHTIGQEIQRMEHPDEAVFYTSGRTSNEAAFLYQLFGRELGTNNFPDCSNMCNESSGVAMTEAVGVGKGTVSLQDFEEAEAIFIFGQNPGTNHPRMLTMLERAAKRGCQILSFNPLREKGLESFVNPQHIVQTLLNKGSVISTHYYQPVIGGDFALLKGLLKAVFEASEKNPYQLDHDFIVANTVGVEELKADITQTLWGDIVQQSGLTQEQILEAAEVYLRSSKTIVCWAMGLTQSKHAVSRFSKL